jgi:hypothetical protein
MNLLADFKISRILLKIKQADTSKFLGQIMVKNLTPSNTMNSVGLMELRGS